MNFSAVLYDRNLSNPRPLNYSFKLYPNRYSYRAVGGPRDASVSVRGSVEDIVSLVHYLRCPIQIFDGRGEPVWWGYVFSAEIRYGAKQINVSLGSMSNSIAVAYIAQAQGQQTGNRRETTEYVTDFESTQIYGTKDKLHSQAVLTSEAAISLRDYLLETKKYPTLAVTSGVSEGGSMSALLLCKGWFGTLNWKHYTQLAGFEGHITGSGYQMVGGMASAYGRYTSNCNQTFKTEATGSWQVLSAELRIGKSKEGALHGEDLQNFPGDRYYLEIREGMPWSRTQLCRSPSYETIDLARSMEWVPFELDPLITIQPGQTYTWKLHRSLMSGTGWIWIAGDTGLGYENGAGWQGIGTKEESYAPYDTDIDFQFKMIGSRETSEQIADLLDVCGRFISDYELTPTNSGIWTSNYRNGDNTGLYYLRDLLDIGVAGGSRYLAELTAERVLLMTEEPSEVQYWVDEQDNWWSLLNVPVPKSLCPAGVWVEFKDMPPSIDGTDIFDPRKYFIEEADYDIDKDIISLTPRGAVNAFETVEFE